MAIRAESIITAARDEHPTFGRRGPNATPDGPALRFLARYQQQLLARIADLKPDAVHTAQKVELPLEDPSAGIALEEHIRVHGAAAHYASCADPVRIVEYPLRLERFTRPAAYVQAGRLYLLGSPDAEWARVREVEIDLFPRGPDELAMDTPLLLPGQPQATCVAAVAAFLSRRSTAEPPPPAAAFAEITRAAEERYLDEVSGRRRAVVSQTREVW